MTRLQRVTRGHLIIWVEDDGKRFSWQQRESIGAALMQQQSVQEKTVVWTEGSVK